MSRRALALLWWLAGVSLLLGVFRDAALQPVVAFRIPPAAPWLQLPETLLMLWLTTLAVPRRTPAELAQLDPLFLGLNVAALVAAAWILAAHRRTVFAATPGVIRASV